MQNGTDTVSLTPGQALILVSALADAAQFRGVDGRCKRGVRRCKPGRRCAGCELDMDEVDGYLAMAPQFVAIARSGPQS
jgi:hypothetical protein